MTQDALSQMLEARDWVLADGATGTALFNQGLAAGEAGELWNVTRADAVRAVHRAALAAGADLFLTNSYGGNPFVLHRKGLGARVAELNRAAAAVAREVADAPLWGRAVIVAGAIGPSDEILAPMGGLAQAAAIDAFEEQAASLKEGGADILWAETLSSREEFRAVSEAARRVGMPWVGTMSFDTAGRTMMGVTSVQLAQYIEKLAHPPVAFGANCGRGASDLLRSVMGFAHAQAEGALARPLVAKGNAGVALYHDGHLHYDGTPELMAEYAVLARDAGARIIGGCCGTMPAHLRAMRAALEARPRAEAGPTLDAVIQRLGPFTSPEDGTGLFAPVQKRGRRLF